MTSTISVFEVFTPSVPAKEAFVERPRINNRLVDAISTPGKQIVLYGHSGSGKTTLIERKLFETYENHVTVSCVKGMTFDAVMLDAFDQLDPFYVSGKRNEDQTEIGVQVSSIWAKVSAAKGDTLTIDSKRALSPQLTVQNLARLIGGAHACWVLEDFHKLEGQEKQKLAQAMKMFMDAAKYFPDIKVVAVGAVGTAREVVSYDVEMRNRVAEIEVPLMDVDEIAKIIETGAGRLGIGFEPAVAKNIVNFSNGIPSICHQLCLSSSIAAGVRTSADSGRVVQETHLKSAVKEFVESASDSMRERFDRAVRRARVRKYDNYSIALRALCEFEMEGALIGEVISVLARLEKNYPSNNISRYLDSLTGETRGSVLRKDATSGRYSFSDPFIRSYCMAYFSQRSNKSSGSRGTQTSVTIDDVLEQLKRVIFVEGSSLKTHLRISTESDRAEKGDGGN